MLFSENFRVAFRSLRANKMRSILTTLGIIIGVAAVIAVVSIVQGLQFMITKQLQGVGATYVMVLPQQDQNQGPGIVARQVRLTWDDGQAILAQVPGIRLMTPLVGGRVTVKYRDRSHEPDFVFGVNQDWPEVSPVDISFYCKPTGGKLMLSSAEQDPVEPHDAWADDMRVPVYARQELGQRQVLHGPAIIEERETTTVLPPAWTATVDRFGCIIATADEKSIEATDPGQNRIERQRMSACAS